jgi:hypothetical protein
MENKINVWEILKGELKGNRLLGRLDTDGRILKTCLKKGVY